MGDVFYNLYNLYVYKIYRRLDLHITRNLKDAGIETRPANSNGIWCPILLPAVLAIYYSLYDVAPLYTLTTFVSVGILAYSLLFVLFLSLSCDILRQPIYGGCVASTLISVLLVYIFYKPDLILSFGCAMPAIYSYTWLLRHSIMACPKTFTIGEAIIVTQSVVLFMLVSIAKFFCDFESDDKELEFVSTIVYTVLSTVGLIVTALCTLRDEDRNLQTLGYIVASGAAFVMLLLHSLLGVACLVNIIKYVFIDKKGAKIFFLWLTLSVIAVISLCFRTKLAVKATTVTRKSFHVLASLVFLSGILFDVYLMTFAAGIGLAVILFVEALRIVDIAPISPALQSAFLVYSDEKDCGLFAMTPLYLYVGLASPLLLVPKHEGQELELLSGVLSIGIGDTAASWFGSKFGFNKWSGSNRTWEGTLFNILSQVGTVYVLQLFELINIKNALYRTMIAATVSGLVEAKTDQVDNLILPLVTVIAFQLTWFMC